MIEAKGEFPVSSVYNDLRLQGFEGVYARIGRLRIGF
jgi:hypothetical protein